MKKILCLMLAFALCFSMYATAEENAGGEAVSNTVTYGPVSFDISDKWVEGVSRDVVEGFARSFLHKHSRNKGFVLIVQDVWNGMPEKWRAEHSDQLKTREDLDSLDIAISAMEKYIKKQGGKIGELEIVELGEYDFCRVPEKLKIPTNWGRIMNFNYSYWSLIDGYIITIITALPMDTLVFSDFLDTMNTLKIGVADES